MTAEAAVADAVQGHHETARRHGLERGQIESLLRVGQADSDPAPGQQAEEGVAIEEFRDQQVLDARCIQHLGQSPRQYRALVTDDGDWPAAIVEPRRRTIASPFERRHVDAVRDCQHRSVRPPGGGDGVGDLLAHTDPDRPPGAVTIELRALVCMPDVLDEVDSRICRVHETTPTQIAPVQPGQEQHVAVLRLPALGHDTVSGGPELLTFTSPRLV